MIEVALLSLLTFGLGVAYGSYKAERRGPDRSLVEIVRSYR